MKFQNKLFVLLCLLLGGVSFNSVRATAIIAYSTGFESSEGYGSSTTYNGTYNGGTLVGGTKPWTVYYGCVSTTGALTGSQSVQCRFYKNQTDHPYAQMNINVLNIASISFKAKVSNTNLSLQLQYSTDNGESWINAKSFTLTTTATKYSYTPESTIASARFRFYVNYKNTHTSNTAQQFLLDDISIEQAVVATALDVKTAPTKVNYKVGETLDLTGLVLDATVGGNHVDVTSGYTAKIDETTVTSGTTTLNTVGAQTITFTYGGQTTTQTIHVGDLESIALTTTGVKTSYDEGQTFDPENLVVTATYSDGETIATTWTESIDLGDCTFDPDGALETIDDNVTVSYTWGSTEKTADIAITVNAASAYTVTFDKGTGTCATSSLTEASAKAGVTLPTATIGVTGWSFAGWATASVSNTDVEPTLYAAGDTYKPIDDCTLYAVYRFTEGTEGDFIRATTLVDVKAATQVILVNGGKTLTTDLSSKDALSESEGVVTAADKTVFTLSGNDTDGYVLSSASGNIGASSLPASNGNYQDLAVTSTNSTWSITTNSTANTFTFLNKGGTNVGLEYYSTGSKWVAYKTSSPTTSSYYSTKVYIPNWTTVYNSNPAAIVNPTIAWTTDGDKTLYLQNTNTYDNAANVTGIAKTPVYTSSDETVATVTAAGVVTALKAGETTITAKVVKEVGMNTEASVTYDVTVKDASNVAGIKAITSTASVVTFTADLTDAVVTYVNGSHAFIQDASGAVYASCGSSLTAGKKINGAVSGSVKAANQIDEITAIDLSDATVTDGVIPDATVITAATLAANKADYEGKLVSIEDATVTANLTTGNASGGKISDDSKVTEINLYAPDSNIDALKDAEGTFNGYITLYSGSTVRLNIFEQSQITLTKNAPTAQTLAFESDAVELDEDTDDYDDFAGQAVSGAVGDVTYSIDSDDDDVVASIDDETGAVVLSGNYGTATIKASAAAKEVTVAGVTTPYTATTKTYTVTVYPRYTVTFNINGDVTALRQATHGAEIDVPTPTAIGDYVFQGWSTATVDATDDKPSMTSVTNAPIADATYYAVYARQGGTPLVEHTSTFTVKQASAPSTPYVNDGSSWTWSYLTFATDASACINSTNGSVTFTLPSGGKAVSLTIIKTSNAWAGAAAVVLKDASSNTLNTFSLGSNASATYEFTSSYDHSTSYTMTNTTGKNAWVDHITFEYTTGGVTYSNYLTTVPCGDVTMAVDKDSEDDYVYATFSSDEDVVFTSDVKVFALEVSGSALVKNELTTGDFLITDESYESGAVEGGYYVPAGNGVLLRAVDVAKIAYYYPTTEQKAEDNPAVPSNKLIAGTGSTPVDSSNKYYKLTYENVDKDNFGFYWGALDGGPFLLKKGKAYLRLPKSASARYFSLDDETTGINSMDNGQLTIDNGAVYDLQGRKIAQPTKGGLYIVNGKKVVLK